MTMCVEYWSETSVRWVGLLVLAPGQKGTFHSVTDTIDFEAGEEAGAIWRTPYAGNGVRPGRVLVAEVIVGKPIKIQARARRPGRELRTIRCRMLPKV